MPDVVDFDLLDYLRYDVDTDADATDVVGTHHTDDAAGRDIVDPNVVVVLADFTDIQFADGTHDLILACLAEGHVDQLLPAV